MKFRRKCKFLSIVKSYKQTFLARSLTLARTRGEHYHPSWNPYSKTWLAAELYSYNLVPIHYTKMTLEHRQALVKFMRDNGYKVPEELTPQQKVTALPSKKERIDQLKEYFSIKRSTQ